MMKTANLVALRLNVCRDWVRLIGDHLQQYPDQVLHCSEDFTQSSSRLGFPAPVGVNIPFDFHPRVEMQDGWDHPLQDDVTFVLVGDEAPPEVIQTVLKHAEPGCIVVANCGQCHSTRMATPILQCGELFAARL